MSLDVIISSLQFAVIKILVLILHSEKVRSIHHIKKDVCFKVAEGAPVFTYVKRTLLSGIYQSKLLLITYV
jgi:hypothetical protein